MRAFSNSDLKVLKSSRFVIKITPKFQIQFTEEFKQLFVSGPSNGQTQTEYFNDLLGVTCFEKKYVDTCLNRWRNSGLRPGKRGRSKSIHKMTFDEIKAENAYMKEVIAHLKKIRGLADDEL